MELERTFLERMPDIERWLRAQVAGARDPVLRVGRPAQRGLQARAGRHQPLPRRLQQPEPVVRAAVRAGGADGGRARLRGRARRAARSREPHAQPALPAATSPRSRASCKQAGLRVRIGTLIPEITAPTEIEVPDGGTLTLEPIVRRGRRVGVGDFDPCMVLLNNDLSAGPPAILQGIEQPIAPPLAAGWYNRLKSHHFEAYHARRARVRRAARHRPVARRSLLRRLRRDQLPGARGRGMPRVERRLAARSASARSTPSTASTRSRS